MKYLKRALFLAGCTAFFSLVAAAQDNTWPKTINTQDGSVIKIYEPTPESFSGNTLKSRAAVSLLLPDSSEPVFGTFWAVETVETDRDNRIISIISAKVPNLKFSGNVDQSKINYVTTALETNIPNVTPDLPLDQVLGSIQNSTEEKKLSKNLDNNPPKIIYASKPSILVLIDGDPKMQHNADWGVDAVVNTPFTIVKNRDNKFYLYGNKHWYSAPVATGPYAYIKNPPANLNTIQQSVDNANNADPGFTNDSAIATSSVPDIIVSTTPAELIQTNGKPVYAKIDGTNLSYATNSQSDLFLSQGDQQYYVLLSGRWFKADNLSGNWQYVSTSDLPADFSKIPPGSPKDNVLASVAGTTEAREAVMDAQVPQTAKVDRRNATADVTYDGDPQFNSIAGTSMQYAINTPSSVILYNGRYYCVDNGVWFESGSPSGPWAVCVQRPDEVDLIPPSCPVYNVKYVYIYDVQPDWVYMGYTPGYLNAYIYGPTIVYGTGYYYHPWWGRHYYARPYTWGFGVRYNPWVGWSLGYDYGFGWLNIGFGYSAWPGYWGGGWWGPSIYRPPFRVHPYSNPRGFYGYRPGRIATRPGVAGRPAFQARPYNARPNNLYNYRRDVISNNNYRFGARPGNTSAARPNNGVRPQAGMNNNARPGTQNRPMQQNIQTDRQGNVYQRVPNNNGQQWQQRQQNQWRPADNNTSNQLNQQQQMQNRGQQRAQEYQMYRQQQNISRPMPQNNSGGGFRGGGGFNGGSRGGGSGSNGGGGFRGGGGGRPR